jgi:MFS family permease
MTADQLARRNLLILTAAQALGASGPPIIVSLGGIVGQTLSPDPTLATLPVSLFNLGLALGTLPAAAIMRRFGRRSGYLLGTGFGMAGGLIAAVGLLEASFLLFCLGTLAAGFYGSYVQSYRFAAADGASGPFKAKAISWVLIGGLLAAIIGPQLVIWTRDATAIPFVGSFLSQAALALIALPVLFMLRAPAPPVRVETGPQSTGRPLLQIMLTPRFMLAVTAGVVSFGLMSFVMTASPVAMIGCGFSVTEAALGIQWHVLAMFGPSFFTGHLIVRFGKEKITAAGLLLIAASAAVALSGLGLAHFWIALILLGLGWNLGFIGATTMITDCHTPEERAKVQGLNDFLVFGSVAVASFSAGSLLTAGGWEMVNWVIFPAVALVLIPLLWRLPSAAKGARPA